MTRRGRAAEAGWQPALRSWRARLGWIAAGVLALLALALGVAYVRRPALEAEPVRLFVNPPEKATRFDYPAISPDGRTLAFVATVEGKPQLWVRPLNSTATKPLAEAVNASFPFWSPDGSRIVWYSNRMGTFQLYQKAANGGGQDEILLKPVYSAVPLDWSADGRFILYRELHPQTNLDLWVLPLEGERKPWPWLNTQFSEGSARFSPDGKWIAYSSNETGRNEIYIQSFVPGAPASGGKSPISTNGGTLPEWRRDGRELYYISADNKLMAVDVTLGTEVKAGAPKELFALSNIRAVTNVGYAKTGDGQRFLFVTSAEEASLPPFTVVLNWMAEMKR